MSQWWNASTPYKPASLPRAASGAAYGIVNGRLWTIGGYEDDGGYALHADVQAYDPIVNTWTSHGTVPTAIGPTAPSAVIGTKIYTLTAQGFFSYDTANGSWSVLTSPPGGLADQIPVVAHDGLVYADMTSTNAAAYDPATDTWASVTQAPSGDRQGGAMVSDGTHVYHYQAGLMQRYDPTADTWTALATQPSGRHAWYPVPALLDGKILLATGLDTVDSLWQPWLSAYDIATDAWEALPDRSVAAYGSIGGLVDDRLYVGSGFAASTSDEVVLTMWGESRPDHVILPVSHRVAWPIESLLVVEHTTNRAGSADAGATLRVAHQTTTGGSGGVLHVMHNPVAPDGVTVAGPPAVGPAVTGSIQERVGSGVTASLERQDGAHPTPADAAFSVTLASADGTYTEYAVQRAVANAPYGKGWQRQDGAPVHTLTTPNPGDVLNKTFLPELVKVPVVSGGGITYQVPGSTTAFLTDLEAPLGARESASEDDCVARMPIDPSGRQTRLDLAREAVAEAGIALVVMGTIPNADRFVERDYRTEDQTAQSVLSDMLLASSPRVWYTTAAVFVDGRTFAGGAGSTDPHSFLGADVLVDDGASWQDQAGGSEPEPVLEDYTDRCTQRDPDATPSEDAEEGVDVPGTFETFEDGTYSWVEKSGQAVGAFDDPADYEETTHTLTKSGGRLVREWATTRTQYRDSYTQGINTFGVTRQTLVQNAYHPICSEALIQRFEETQQRKTVEDIPQVSNRVSATEDGPFTASEEQVWLFDALPTWWVENETLVSQRWHAEGWLRARNETTRRLSGMIASPTFDANGEQDGYEVTLTYETETRSETYLPVGGGLWHIGTTTRRTEQRPVYEPVNPDAVEGDDDYGEMELVRITPTRVSNHYTEVTDRAPASISCGGTEEDPEDPCAESDDPYAECIAAATKRFEIDHADWEARQAHNGPKRVWSLQANRFLPGVTIGQTLGGGLVAGVTHDRDSVGGSTSLEVWEWLA